MSKELTIAEASSLIGLVYDASLEKNQWSSLVRELFTLCPGHTAAVLTFEDARWVSSHVPSIPDGEVGGQMADLIDDVEAGVAPQPRDLNDVLFARQPLALGTLYSTRHIFSEDEFRNFDVYRTTMKPIGAGHWAGTNFSISGDRRAQIMVVENEFDETPKNAARVEEIIKLIAPHMVRASAFSRALTMAKDAAETYSAFIDAIALPMVILSREGQLQMANSIGQRVLNAGEVLKLDAASGRVSLAHDMDTKALRSAIAAAQKDRGPHAFQAQGDDGYVAMCVCPYRPALAFASGIDKRLLDGQELYAIFIGARSSGTVSLRLLQDAFALTAREAEVCSGLLEGRAPSELASAMDRSEKTIRNQIRAVHDKVGVTSTRELTDVLSVFRSVGAMYAEGWSHLSNASRGVAER